MTTNKYNIVIIVFLLSFVLFNILAFKVMTPKNKFSHPSVTNCRQGEFIKWIEVMLENVYQWVPGTSKFLIHISFSLL